MQVSTEDKNTEHVKNAICWSSQLLFIILLILELAINLIRQLKLPGVCRVLYTKTHGRLQKWYGEAAQNSQKTFLSYCYNYIPHDEQ